MKITMYELLGLVKDDKAPKKIKYKNMICYFNEKEKTYCLDRSNIELFHIEKITERLNDEVEILEEEKKIPEKIKDKYNSQISKVELAQKYNEIIDYLDYLKSKGDE